MEKDSVRILIIRSIDQGMFEDAYFQGCVISTGFNMMILLHICKPPN